MTFEFFLIIFAVTAFLVFLSWKPVRQFISTALDLSILAFLVGAISLLIWLLLLI